MKKYTAPICELFLNRELEIDMLRVAIIEPVGNHGGLDYIDYKLLEYTRSIDVESYLFSAKKIDSSPLNKFVYEYFDGIYSKSKIIGAFHFFVAFVKSILVAKILKCQIVHYHFFEYRLVEMLMVSVANFFNFKIVISAHDVSSFDRVENNKHQFYCMSNASIIIAHNKHSMDCIQKKYTQFSKKIAYVPHGHFISERANLISRAAARSCLNVDQNTFLVLLFGQIKKTKGLHILLNALARIENKASSVQVLIAGRPWRSDFTEYSEQISNLRISDRTICHIKFIPQREVAAYFSAADLVALPYTEIYQSGVLIYAMSLGRPVVVSDLPPMLEYIHDGISGLTFRSGDASDLALKIELAATDERALEDMAREAEKFVVENNNWEVVAERTRAAYLSALGKLPAADL